ncbi:MAG: hypothetical protein MK171_10320 [Pirellulales bacterium]|nr:hypothetical protein [Pirellulales bacterium]
MSMIFGGIQPVYAVTRESPEVRKLVEEGKKYLEQHTDERLGGKCLIAFALLKDRELPTHPRIQQALEACQNTPSSEVRSGDVYSNGLAIIFLTELDGSKHKDLISRYAGTMASRQKKNGAWGYESTSFGDTSQTQYAALSAWKLMQVGLPPRVAVLDGCTNWLLRTQDPSGTWGYQGNDTDGSALVKQSRTSLSMMAAGMGSTMILGNLLGILTPGSTTTVQIPQEQLPSVLRRAKTKSQMRTLSGSGVDPQQMHAAILRGQAWYDKNFSARLIKETSEYPCYLLYSLERYKSFEELWTGSAPEEPEWYQLGYEYLKERQLEHGGWHSRSGDACATAFAMLFLMRSTQVGIKASLGEGTLIGGRGLSKDLSRMRIQGGRLVTKHKPTETDQLLAMLEGPQSEELDELLRDPAALADVDVDTDGARRLQQVVKSGTPEARVLAVRALARLRNLDHVGTLLYAMTDPDKRVVRAARDGLCFVSRHFSGFGLPLDFNDTQRFNALDKWKAWYRQLRPNAIIMP